jgi:DNA-binding transcriptional MerR regulator
MVWPNLLPAAIQQLHQRPRLHRPEVNQPKEAGGPRSTGKSGAAFRTTGEVSEQLELPAHVLRFWESKFPEIKPLKRGGGRRYYRPEDVDLLRRIRQFLYHEGYTIRGVQKLLRESGLREEATAPAESEGPPMLFSLEPAPEPPDPPVSRQALQTALEEVRRELVAIRELLEKVLVR